MLDETVPQGDVRLLETDTARRLLATPVPARLAYTAKDGTPRVIPINFVWTGDELVMGAFAGTYKVSALQARPVVAVSIDTAADSGAQALLLRGTVTVAEVAGLLPEYAAAQRAVIGAEASEPYLRAIDKPGLRMVRLGLRPSWVGVLDFRTRFPQRTPQAVLDALRASA